MASETRLDEDLAAAHVRTQILAPNNPYTSFAVVSDGGGVIELQAGNGPFFPYNTGDYWEVDDPCEPERGGIFLKSAAQPGVRIILQVALAEGGASRRAGT